MSRPGSTLAFSGHYAPSPGPEGSVNHNYPTHQETMDRFGVRSCRITETDLLNSLKVMTQDLEAVMIQLPVQSLAALPPNHDVRHLIRQILFLAGQAAERQRTPLLMSQKIVQLLYKTASQLGREVYTTLLDQLCRTFDDVAKEA